MAKEEENHLVKFLNENKENVIKSMSGSSEERLIASIDNAIAIEKSKGFNPKTEKIKVKIDFDNGNLTIHAVKVKK